jgi:hypothetical protein
MTDGTGPPASVSRQIDALATGSEGYPGHRPRPGLPGRTQRSSQLL